MTNYTEIAKKIIAEGYNAVGVRNAYDDETYEVGDTCRESYEWDLAEDVSTYHTTGLTAGGTCATEINIDAEDAEELAANIETAVKQNEAYLGDAQYIIAGYETCNLYDLSDDNEVRIVDAEVLAAVK